MHRPGIEPGSRAYSSDWEARILPLNHRCLWLKNVIRGLYSDNEKEIFIKLVRPKILPFSFGEEDHYTPGTHVQASCIVGEGDLPVELSWTFHGQREESSSMMGITTTRLGPRSSILQIESLVSSHSGEYTCTAKNTVGSQNFTTHLKVLGIICIHPFTQRP